MGKIKGMVMARAKAAPVQDPVANIPVATPAFSLETQALTSLGRLGYDNPIPIPEIKVNARRLE